MRRDDPQSDACWLCIGGPYGYHWLCTATTTEPNIDVNIYSASASELDLPLETAFDLLVRAWLVLWRESRSVPCSDMKILFTGLRNSIFR